MCSMTLVLGHGGQVEMSEMPNLEASACWGATATWTLEQAPNILNQLESMLYFSKSLAELNFDLLMILV